MPGPLWITNSRPAGSPPPEVAYVPSSVLTPGCRCGWVGTETFDHDNAEHQLDYHGYTAHVATGEWPATYMRDDGDVAKLREAAGI